MLQRPLNISRSLIRTLTSGKARQAAKTIPAIARGMALGDRPRTERLPADLQQDNPLLRYFDANREGHGIWKWRHYFEVYHRHFSQFVGTDVHVMEIGVYSGGSLPMWREYFGPKAHIYGVDIERACEVYRSSQVEILIGDQGNRQFWSKVRRDVHAHRHPHR